MSGLFKHQIDGAAWLAGRDRAYLGDKPGLGKTRTIIEGLYRAGAMRPLVVCPAIVRTHWRREFGEHGYRDDFAILKSYDEITRGGNQLMAELIRTQAVDSLVLDEAHYCKSTESKRSVQLLGANGYARRLPIVWAASGTPVPRHPGELATTVLTLFPHVALAHGIRTPQQWRDRFCITKQTWARGAMREKVVGMKNADELHEILGEVMLRREPGGDVPKMWWQTVRLDASDVEALISETSQPGDEWNRIRGHIAAGRPLSDLVGSAHVATIRRRIGELKVAPVAEMLRSQLADSEEKIVVMAYHRTVLAELREALGPFGVVYIDGDTPTKWRDLAIDQFQTSASTRVFLGQQQACMTGITLTAARRVVLVEPSWINEDNVQAAARIDRIGQKAQHLSCQMIALAGTLDEAIVGQCQREAAMSAASLSPITGVTGT